MQTRMVPPGLDAMPSLLPVSAQACTTTLDATNPVRDFAARHAVIANLVHGGNIHGNLQALWNSQINVNGGSVHGNLLAFGKSQVNICEGHVHGNLLAQNNSRITVHGGYVGNLALFGNTRVAVYGGTIHGLQANDHSRIQISGGTVHGNLEVLGNSIITLVGINLAFTQMSPFGLRGVVYTLTGKLLDGTDVTGKQVYSLDREANAPVGVVLNNILLGSAQ